MGLQFLYYIRTRPSDPRLHVFRSSSTSDNLHQFASNDGLSGTVEKNLELVDHVTCVLGRVVHGVATGGLLASVAFGESPEQGVRESVLAEVAKCLIVNLEGSKIGYDASVKQNM